MSGNNYKANWLQSSELLHVPDDFEGVTVVISPHPDDESLGCGGTIALLKNACCRVVVIFVSDGSMSHPNSSKYAAPLLKQLRKKEAVVAAGILGLPECDCIFMNLPDGSLPWLSQPGFAEAVAQMAALLKQLTPQTLLLPWKNDPHKDHQACWQIVHAAIIELKVAIKLLHYLIWFWERGDVEDTILHKAKWKRIDIRNVMERKHDAIVAHASQVTLLIDDDETGFMLSEEVLSHFYNDFELFAST